MSFAPIETRYKGYRFRSRVEARWAVFFDAMEWDWEYEKEGFDLDGMLYLPDFLLKNCDTWVEIKGAPPTADEVVKCGRLAKHTNQAVLILFGEPWPDKHGALFLSDGEPVGGPESHFVRCGLCYQDEGISFNTGQWMRLGPECECKRGNYRRVAMDAYSAARAARFEHGEDGQVTARVYLPPPRSVAEPSHRPPLRPEIEAMAEELKSINSRLERAVGDERATLLARKTELIGGFIDASPMQ